jgi:hypothetical protein
MRILGFIDAIRFGSEEGRKHVAEANELAAARGLVWDVIQGRFYLAMIDQARGDTDEARAGLREVLRLAAEHGHHNFVEGAEKGLAALEAGVAIRPPE